MVLRGAIESWLREGLSDPQGALRLADGKGRELASEAAVAELLILGLIAPAVDYEGFHLTQLARTYLVAIGPKKAPVAVTQEQQRDPRACAVNPFELGG